MGAARVTESEYTTIKQLLAKGYEGQKVAEIVGRARSLVSRVKNSNDYKDYTAKCKVLRKKPDPKQLPLDTPKKTTLDLREDITIKFNSLIESIDMIKRSTCTSPSNFKQEIAYSRAKVHLEEARLWLKEVF